MKFNIFIILTFLILLNEPYNTLGVRRIPKLRRRGKEFLPVLMKKRILLSKMNEDNDQTFNKKNDIIYRKKSGSFPVALHKLFSDSKKSTSAKTEKAISKQDYHKLMSMTDKEFEILKYLRKIRKKIPVKKRWQKRNNDYQMSVKMEDNFHRFAYYEEHPNFNGNITKPDNNTSNSTSELTKREMRFTAYQMTAIVLIVMTGLTLVLMICNCREYYQRERDASNYSKW